MKKIWIGLAMSSAFLLGACGNDATSNESPSEPSADAKVLNEFAEIDAKMHEYSVAYIAGKRDLLAGTFYEGDNERYNRRALKDDFVPNTFEDIKYYFQYRNVGNQYEIWRTNLYEPEGFLLYIVRYHHELTDTKMAQSFVVEKLDGEWQIRYRGGFKYKSPKLEGHFPSGIVDGGTISKLIELYPEKATKVVSYEETKEYYDAMTDEKRIELQPYFDEWDSKHE